jgi:hypothetical protein
LGLSSSLRLPRRIFKDDLDRPLQLPCAGCAIVLAY